MNNELQLYNPRVGMRFTMRGNDFEVCHAEYGMVRFASSRGGKPHRIKFDEFKVLQEKGEISKINPDLHGQDLINANPAISNLTDSELAFSLRRIRYAKAAIAELTHPNSKRALANWIPAFSELMKDSNPPKPRTVSDWVEKFLLGGEKSLMAPNRKSGNRRFRFSPEIELLILDAINQFLQEEQRDAKDVLAYVVGHLAEQNLLTKDDSKIRIPSERTVRRILSRIDPYLLIRIKKGRLAAERMSRAAGKSIISPRPLHLVQIDTHFLKVFVTDPDTGELLGKPYLVCAFDVRTRCVVGIYISLLPASSATTMGVMIDMLTRPSDGLPGGVPLILIPDNGVEFRNSGVERLVGKLKIQFEPAVVCDPNGKAHIESFFRTLSLFLIQKIEGTTFSGLEKRGDYPSEKKAYATLAQIEEYVRYWVENEYHTRPHSSTGRIPIRQWEEEMGGERSQLISRETVNAIARRPYSLNISNGQVRIRRLKYFSHALKTIEASFSGKVTVLLDELNLSQVLIEHPYEKGVLIQADSTDPEYTHNLSLWEHEESMKIMDAQTNEDIKAIGKFTPLLARWTLIQKLQSDSKMAKTKIAKLTGGKGRISHAKKCDIDLNLETSLHLDAVENGDDFRLNQELHGLDMEQLELEKVSFVACKTDTISKDDAVFSNIPDVFLME
jgi:putative transposase